MHPDTSRAFRTRQVKKGQILREAFLSLACAACACMPVHQNAASASSPQSSASILAAAGTSSPGTSSPGTSSPGTSSPGTSSPGTGSPGTGSPGTSSPGTGSPGTKRQARAALDSASEELPSVANPLVIAAVGDIMLGSTFPEKDALLPPDNGSKLLAEVTPVLAGADLAFGNLEGPLLDSGPSEKCKNSKPGHCYAFRVPTRYGSLLKKAGFDALSLANNHVGDFGDAGRKSTRAVLDQLGIYYSGAVGEAARMKVRGLKVAVIAFSISSDTNDLTDIPGASRLVAGLKADSDLVIVSFHGGAEGADKQHVPSGEEKFYGESRGNLRRFSRAVIDAGAGLVIGHGPHVLRGMEIYKGKLIAYSLGNFATYGGISLAGPGGITAVLEARLAADGTFLGGQLHAARQDRPGGPRWDSAKTAIQQVRDLSRADFGSNAVKVSEDGALTSSKQN